MPKEKKNMQKDYPENSSLASQYELLSDEDMENESYNEEIITAAIENEKTALHNQWRDTIQGWLQESDTSAEQFLKWMKEQQNVVTKESAFERPILPQTFLYKDESPPSPQASQVQKSSVDEPVVSILTEIEIHALRLAKKRRKDMVEAAIRSIEYNWDDTKEPLGLKREAKTLLIPAQKSQPLQLNPNPSLPLDELEKLYTSGHIFSLDESVRNVVSMVSGLTTSKPNQWPGLDIEYNNIIVDGGNSLLHYAARYGQKDIVAHLLDEGYLHDHANRAGLTPLHVAAYFGEEDVVQLLTDKTTQLTLVPLQVHDYKVEVSALHLAILGGHERIADKLLKEVSEADQVRVGKLGNILHLAVLRRNSSMLRALLYHPRVLAEKDLYNELNEAGYTPLTFAVKIRDVIAAGILAAHVEVEFKKTSEKRCGYTLFHEIAKRGEYDLFTQVIQRIGSRQLIAFLFQTTDNTINKYTPYELAKSKVEEYTNDFYKNHNNASKEKANRYAKLTHKLALYEKAICAAKPLPHLFVRNLVFQGCGLSGINSFIGAFLKLTEPVSSVIGDYIPLTGVTRVASSSLASGIALMVALNYTPNVLLNLIQPFDLNTFFDEKEFGGLNFEELIQQLQNTQMASSPTSSMGAIFNLNPIRQLFGGQNKLRIGKQENFIEKLKRCQSRDEIIHIINSLEWLGNGNTLLNWIETIIQQKLQEDRIGERYGPDYEKNLTFGRLRELINRGEPYKHLYLVTYCVDDKALSILNSEEPNSPWDNVKISHGVRAAISLIGLLKPYQILQKDGSGREIKKHYMDGGFLWNYPIKLFDKMKYLREQSKEQSNDPIYNEETLGLCVTPSFSTLEPREFTSNDYKNILKILINENDIESKYHIADKTDDVRTIYTAINNMGIETWKYTLTDSQQKELVNAGYKAAKDFLNERGLNSSKRRENIKSIKGNQKKTSHIQHIISEEVPLEVIEYAHAKEITPESEISILNPMASPILPLNKKEQSLAEIKTLFIPSEQEQTMKLNPANYQALTAPSNNIIFEPEFNLLSPLVNTLTLTSGELLSQNRLLFHALQGINEKLDKNALWRKINTHKNELKLSSFLPKEEQIGHAGFNLLFFLAANREYYAIYKEIKKTAKPSQLKLANGMTPSHIAAFYENHRFLEKEKTAIPDFHNWTRTIAGQQVTLNELHICIRKNDRKGAAILLDRIPVSTPLVPILGSLIHLAVEYADEAMLRDLLWRSYQDCTSIQGLMTAKNYSGLNCLELALMLNKFGHAHFLIEGVLWSDIRIDNQQNILSTAFYTLIEKYSKENDYLKMQCIQDGVRYLFYKGFVPNANHPSHSSHMHAIHDTALEANILEVITKGFYSIYQKPNIKAQRYENIVFAGGGMKGAIYPYLREAFDYCDKTRNEVVKSDSGSDMELDEVDRMDVEPPAQPPHTTSSTIKRAIGTSAGSIFALLYALDVEKSIIEKEMSKDFSEFLEGHDKEAKALTDNEKTALDKIFTVFEALGAKTPVNQEIANSMLSTGQGFFNKSPTGKLAAVGSGLLNAARHPINTATKGYDLYQEIKAVKDTLYELNKFSGFCTGAPLYKWLEQLIEQAGFSKEMTLGEWAAHVKSPPEGKQYKHLYVVATNLTKGRVEILSSEDDYYKDYVIVDAVRASMSIPLVFQPHHLRVKRIIRGHATFESLKSEYVDGGLLCNFAVKAFDTKQFTNPGHRGEEMFPEFNKKTIGFRFEPTTFTSGKYCLVKEYLPRILDFFYNAEDVLGACYDADYHRSITVNTGDIGTLTFQELNADDKDKLKLEAWSKVCGYFKVTWPEEIQALNARLEEAKKEIEHENPNKEKVAPF